VEFLHKDMNPFRRKWSLDRKGGERGRERERQLYLEPSREVQVGFDTTCMNSFEICTEEDCSI